MFVFLFSLWCFKLCLVSLLCCSRRIMFVCWTCIHLMLLCFINYLFGWSFALLSDHCTHFHMTAMCLIKLLVCFMSYLLDCFLLVAFTCLLLLALPWGSNVFCANISSYRYFVPSSLQVLDLDVTEFCHCS